MKAILIFDFNLLIEILYIKLFSKYVFGIIKGNQIFDKLEPFLENSKYFFQYIIWRSLEQWKKCNCNHGNPDFSLGFCNIPFVVRSRSGTWNGPNFASLMFSDILIVFTF